MGMLDLALDYFTPLQCCGGGGTKVQWNYVTAAAAVLGYKNNPEEG
jgi:hypothetical protein